jgi:hypothetical protein
VSTLKVNNLQDLGADAVVTNGVIDSSALPAGSILQVVSTTTDTATATTSASYVDTACAATITPTSATSKIMVIATGVLDNTGGSDLFIRLFRGTVSGTALGPTDGGQLYAGSSIYILTPFATSFLDSPSTTSATTYTLGLRRSGGGATIQTTDNQTMILMEVAG